MAKQRFKGFQSGMSFRRLKKVLKRQEREADDYEGKVKCVSGCYVKIKFSKEIAYFDDKAYHYNPKFDLWWADFSAKVEKDHHRYGYLHVAYSNPKTMKREEGNEYHTHLVRWLIMGEKAIMLNTQMSFFYIVPPSEFCTNPGYALYHLKNAMEDCARFCGGTVEFSYSDMYRIPVSDAIYKTMVLGKEGSDEQS
ncbi:MAG: hypothetical protein K6F74_05495 [Prevotella sp.]|nr:hypothetical protein [Prevotella sp.]